MPRQTSRLACEQRRARSRWGARVVLEELDGPRGDEHPEGHLPASRRAPTMGMAAFSTLRGSSARTVLAARARPGRRGGLTSSRTISSRAAASNRRRAVSCAGPQR